MTIAYDRDIVSSNISAVAYVKGRGYVEFHGGRRFAYEMPKALFDQMRAAKSIGTFFSANVKGKCKVAWTGYACSCSPCQADATLQAVIAGAKVPVCEPCSKDGRFAGIEFTAIPEANAANG